MRIFTVNRESGSSLKCQTKPVCTRSSRSRIAHAASLFAVVAASTLTAQVTPGTASAPLSSQGVETLCQPQVIGNRRIPKESVLARLSADHCFIGDVASTGGCSCRPVGVDDLIVSILQHDVILE